MIWPFNRNSPPDPKAARHRTPDEHLTAAREVIMASAGDADLLAAAIQQILVRSCEEAVLFDREQAWRRYEEENHKARLCAQERKDHQDALDREAKRRIEEADAVPRAAALAAARLGRLKEIEQLRASAKRHDEDACSCGQVGTCASQARSLRQQAFEIEATL